MKGDGSCNANDCTLQEAWCMRRAKARSGHENFHATGLD